MLTLPAGGRVVAASGVSNLSDGVWAAALPLLAAASTSSPLAVAVVFAAGQVPWLAVGVWGGGLIDRRNRVRVLREVTVLRAAVVVALAVLVAGGAVGVGLLVVAALCVGAGEAMADTATEALVPALVNPEALGRVNSRLLAAQITGNELAGPALGGVLFVVGASVPLFTNASLLIVAVLLLAAIPAWLGIATQPAKRSATHWNDGFAVLLRDPTMRAVTCASASLAAIDAAWFALLVLVADRQLGVGGAGFGALLAIGAVGGLIGAASAERHRSLPLSRIGSSAFCAMGVSLLLLALLPNVAMTVAALAITSGAFAFWNIASTTARQIHAPTGLLGRVSGSYRSVVVAAAIAGALLGGWLASIASLRTTLAGAGALALAVAPRVATSLRT